MAAAAVAASAAEETPRARTDARPLYAAIVVAAVIAAGAWAFYVERGAHLLHFDAKAHLVVARRTLDSLTPGWRQLGAIWLPLPHILNALPSQNDRLYATGLFGSVLSFVTFVIAIVAIALAARRATGDPWAGVVAAAVPALNPGWLYLQSTPLIEALFLGTVAGALAGLVAWRVDGSRRGLAAAVVASALACWVRYEAWPLLTLAAAWITATEPPERRRRVGLLLLGCGVALPTLAYGIHSWGVSGIPFYVMGSGNLTERRGDVLHSLRLTGQGVWQAFGGPLVAAGVIALGLCARRARHEVLAALGIAALAPIAITFVGYFAGHPPKARYPLLLAPALALLLAAATSRRLGGQAAALVAAVAQVVAVPRPLPVLRESTRDKAAVAERLPVLDEFQRRYTGGRVLASMASAAPVLYEMGQRGLPLREVVHEGNDDWWDYAVVDPAREVAWVLIVQGDVLDGVRRVRPAFPEGFEPALQFRRVVLYRRMSALTASPPVAALD